MVSRWVRTSAWVAVVGCGLGAACAYGQAAKAPEALTLTGQFVGTHDPSIGEDHGKFYVFATGAARPAGRGWVGDSATACAAGWGSQDEDRYAVAAAVSCAVFG